MNSISRFSSSSFTLEAISLQVFPFSSQNVLRFVRNHFFRCGRDKVFASSSSSRLTCVDEIFTVYEDIKNVTDSAVRYSLFSSIKPTHDFHLSASPAVVGNPIFIFKEPRKDEFGGKAKVEGVM